MDKLILLAAEGVDLIVELRSKMSDTTRRTTSVSVLVDRLEKVFTDMEKELYSIEGVDFSGNNKKYNGSGN